MHLIRFEVYFLGDSSQLLTSDSHCVEGINGTPRKMSAGRDALPRRVRSTSLGISTLPARIFK